MSPPRGLFGLIIPKNTVFQNRNKSHLMTLVPKSPFILTTLGIWMYTFMEAVKITGGVPS